MSNKLYKDDNKQKSSLSKNQLGIIILSAVIVVSIAIYILISSVSSSDQESNTNSSNGGNKVTSTAGAQISIVDEAGNQSETISADINFRDIVFGKSIKQIKKMENKMDDTLDEPAVATSQDGYTYLTYSFNKEANPEFFGTAISTTSKTAMLVYVFYNNSLIEVRVQYGAIGTDGYNAIVGTGTNLYGKATYSRSYSNGAMESWWKTSEVKLDVIYQDGDVVAYYSTTNK